MIALCQCGCGIPAPISDRTDSSRGRMRSAPLRFVHGHNRRKPRQMPATKACCTCGLTKPSSDFYLEGRRPDGLTPRCKKCVKHAARESYYANPDAARKRMQKWRKDNPETRRGLAADYDARKQAAFIESVDRRVVWGRDLGLCGICGRAASPEDYHIDHIRPISAGGLHCYENVQVAHPGCNQRKHTQEAYHE